MVAQDKFQFMGRELFPCLFLHNIVGRAVEPKGYTLIGWGLNFFILHALIFLDGDKTPAAVLAFPQISFFFLVTNPTRNIESYLKTGSLTAMRAKLGWHGFTPHSPILKSTDHADKEVYVLQQLVRLSPFQPI